MKQWAASSLREWTSNRTRWKRRLCAVGLKLAVGRTHDWMNSYITAQAERTLCWGERHVDSLANEEFYIISRRQKTFIYPHERVLKRLSCMYYGLTRHYSVSIGLDFQDSHLQSENMFIIHISMAIKSYSPQPNFEFIYPDSDTILRCCM